MSKGFPEKAWRKRFGRDAVIALATIDKGVPAVREVNGYYEDGVFYVITYELSGKMRQIRENPSVAVCGEWFTARGTAQSLGSLRDPRNEELFLKSKKVFSAWYDNGHIDENDPNTCILCIRLTDGVLYANGTRYELDFTAD